MTRSEHDDVAEQPALLPDVVRARARTSRQRAEAAAATPAADLAEVDPVASVLVDVPLAHLDRPFDYAVPAKLADSAQPGVRAKVRFAGQDVDGFVLARSAASEHPGSLRPLRRVVSAEPVLTPEVAAVTAALAERYAGTRGDVLRLAVPPRHATTEKQPSPPAVPVPEAVPVLSAGRAAWADHEPGGAFLGHLAAGGTPRAVWTAAPGSDWPLMLAHAVAAAYVSGRGALVCLPDGRDVDRVSAALAEVLGDGHHVTLRADAGPAARYRDFLAVSRGTRRVVVGTRAAALAPVADLGLVAIWDDGDDLHAEPRAPYPHTRETLLLRAEEQGTAVLVGGFARTVEGAQLLRSGWAHPVAASRATVRERVSVVVAGAEDREVARDPAGRGARFPTAARDAVRDALTRGPVLVQVPRGGYAPSLACARCREPARCARCSGPLAVAGRDAAPTCRWCGSEEPGRVCGECGETRLRAPVRGSERTTEELGRALPGVRLRTSAGDTVLASVPDEPAVVVATPGAEPVAGSDGRGGYAAVVLLDTWLALGRVDLRSDEEALRRWLGAAGAVRPGGRVVVVGDPTHPAVQALVRWDPAGFADREAAARAEAGLPPASRIASLTAEPAVLAEALELLAVPDRVDVLGPVPAGTTSDGEPLERAVLRVPRAAGPALSRALGHLQRQRSARKQPAIRVQVDPPTL